MQVDSFYMGWYDTMRANTSLYGLIHGRADRYVTMRVDISLCMLVLTKWVEVSLYAHILVDMSQAGRCVTLRVDKNYAC